MSLDHKGPRLFLGGSGRQVAMVSSKKCRVSSWWVFYCHTSGAVGVVSLKGMGQILLRCQHRLQIYACLILCICIWYMYMFWWFDMICMILYDVIRYGVIWYDVVWNGMIWYDIIWYDMICAVYYDVFLYIHDINIYNMCIYIYRMIWFDMIWFDLICYIFIYILYYFAMIWYDLIWYMICFDIYIYIYI